MTGPAAPDSPPHPNNVATETATAQPSAGPAVSAATHVSTESGGGIPAPEDRVSHRGGIDMSPRGAGGDGGGTGVVGEDEEQLGLRLMEMPNGLRVWWSSHGEEEALFIFGEVFEDRTYGRMGVRVQDGDTIWDVGKIHVFGNTSVNDVGKIEDIDAIDCGEYIGSKTAIRLRHD